MLVVTPMNVFLSLPVHTKFKRQRAQTIGETVLSSSVLFAVLVHAQCVDNLLEKDKTKSCCALLTQVRRLCRVIKRSATGRAVASTSAHAHSTTDMALAKSVYNLLFRRTSTFAITIMVGAVFFERLFDQGGDAIFEQMNRGVSVSFWCFNARFILTL